MTGGERSEMVKRIPLLLFVPGEAQRLAVAVSTDDDDVRRGRGAIRPRIFFFFFYLPMSTMA